MRENRKNHMRENMTDNVNSTTAEGFCDGCGRRCPLSAPQCPTGMKKAGMEIPEGTFEGRKGGEHKGDGHEQEEHRRGRHSRENRERGERRGEGREHDEHKGDRDGHNGHRHGHRRSDDGERGRDWLEGASEEDLLFHSIRRCGNHLRHGGEKRSSQQELLSFLSSAGGSAVQSELGNILHVRRASISELLAKMESRGLIERHPDENDRRQLIVSLTAQGFSATGESADHRRAETSALFSVLSDEEKKQLQTLLDKLLASWKEQ